MSTMYLINTVHVQLGQSSYVEYAGALIPDNASIQASLVAAGAVLAPTTDATVTAAANLVASQRKRGANEADCNALMLAAYASSVTKSRPVKVTIDIPLATIQAQTSTVAFNIGAALPAGASLISHDINVIATVTGGAIASCGATIQNTGETAGAVQASTDVFTATGVLATAGSNPVANRGGQQLQMTLTTAGDTLAHATTGHLAVDLTYFVP
jgi:hypothetical protein